MAFDLFPGGSFCLGGYLKITVTSRNTLSGLGRYLPKRFFSRPMQVVLDLVVLTALDDLSDPEGVGF